MAQLPEIRRGHSAGEKAAREDAAREDAHDLGSGQSMERLPELATGQYWQARRDAEDGNGQTIEAGTALLVLEVRLVDGAPHTIVLHPHPLDPQQQRHRFLFEDFRSAFELCHDAEALRAREAGDVQLAIAALQEEIQQAPLLGSPRAGGPGGALPSPMGALLGSNPTLDENGRQVALTQDRLDRMRQAASERALSAERQSVWLTERTKELGEKTELLGRFYTERSKAAIAGVQSVIDYAERLNQGLTSLGLYTGENVLVETLCEGPEAPVDAPLTIFQRKLFLDEEYAVNLGEGGADWKSLEDFANALETDEALLERMMPAPRAVVAVQWRRRDREYLEIDSAAAALLNEMMNQPNRRAFLLVRNGRNVHRVFSEVATEKTSRLFPTTDEANRPFRGVFRDDEEITIESVRFTDSLREHEKIALHYRRLLVLLWGLNDRLGLFGEFYDRSSYRSFMEPGFQQEHFRFVYDDERLLAGNRPKLRDFIRDMNRHLQSGSRVLCHWPRLLTPAIAPACVKNREGRSYHGYDVRYQPTASHGVCVAFRRGEEIFVETEVEGWSWATNGDRRFTAKFNLSVAQDRFAGAENGFFVLDAVTPEDIEHYIHDRAARADYLFYLQSFFEIRALLRADRKHEAPMREALAAAFEEAGFAGGTASSENANEEASGEAIGKAIDEAVRLWRASMRGASLPQRGDDGWKKAYETLLASAFRLAGLDSGERERAEELARREGREPLRLVLTGRGKLALYATPAEAEIEERLGTHPWVVRIALDRGKRQLKETSRSWTTLPEALASESEVETWEGARSWVALTAPGGLGYEEAVELLARIDRCDEEMEQLCRPLVGAEFEEWLEDFRRRMIDLSDRLVDRPDVWVPIGVARLDWNKRVRHRVVGLQVDEAEHFYRLGNAEQRRSIEAVIRRIYSRPASAIEELRRCCSGTPEATYEIVPVLAAEPMRSGLRTEILEASKGHVVDRLGPADQALAVMKSAPDDDLRKQRNTFFRDAVKELEIVYLAEGAERAIAMAAALTGGAKIKDLENKKPGDSAQLDEDEETPSP